MPGAAAKLVPGTPVAALICRYNGLPQPGMPSAGFGLVAQRTLGAKDAGRLAQAFDTLEPWPPGTATSCPEDNGADAAVYFRYADGGDEPVSVSLSGCESSSNGHLLRLSSPPLVSSIQSETSFIHAHETTVNGRVCVTASRPQCVAPKLIHLSRRPSTLLQPRTRSGRIRSGTSSERRRARACGHAARAGSR